MLWPRFRSLPVTRPPSVRFGRASKPCPHVLFAMCPPCVCLECALAAPPNLSALCLPLVFALCVSTMCPPCVRSLSPMCPLFVNPRLWTLSARGLLWGRAMASSSKILSRHCATHSVYIACPLVSFLGIHFGSPNSAFANAPYA